MYRARCTGFSQGFAVHADPDKPAELVRVIQSLLSDMNKLRTMGAAAGAAAPAYDRVKELQKFTQLIDEIAGP